MYKIVLFMVIINSIFNYDITAADEKMKFAGISLGMSSRDVISKFMNGGEHRVFGGEIGRITNMESLFTGENEDTLRQYSNNQLNRHFRCGSKKLTIGKDYEGNYMNLKSIEYNQISISQPTLIFQDDTLISWSGSFLIKRKEYRALLMSLSEKYGNPSSGIHSFTFTSWKKGDYVIKLSPSLDRFQKESNKSLDDQDLYAAFELYNEKVYNNCSKSKEEELEKQYKEFVLLSENKLKLNGLHPDMNKAEVYNYLKNNDKAYVYYGKDCKTEGNSQTSSFALVDTLTNGQQINVANVIKDGRNLPDTLRFEYNDIVQNFRIILEFYEDRLFSIQLTKTLYANKVLKEKLHGIMIQFAKNNKSVLRQLKKHGNSNLFEDTYTLNYGDNQLQMFLSNISDQATFKLFSKSILDKRNIDKENALSKQIDTLLSKLDNASIYNYQIGSSRSNINIWYSSNPFTDIKNRNPIDCNFKPDIHVFYDDDLTFKSTVRKTNGEFIYAGENYCCGSDIVEIITKDESIQSISSAIHSRSIDCLYNMFHNMDKDKENIINLITDKMNKRYGAGTLVDYNTRKSKYWIVNANLFELILEEKKRLFHNHTNLKRVYFSFRKLSSSDEILRDLKKSLID